MTASLAAIPLLSTEERSNSVEKVLGWLYAHGGSVYEARGLFEFKDKFAPVWKPIFLLHSTKTSLPRIGLALGRAFMPDQLREIVYGVWPTRTRRRSTG